MKRNILFLLNVIALVCALIWLAVDHSWEPLVTSIVLICGLLAGFVGKNNEGKTIYKQKGGKKSKNYQGNGDIIINGK